MRQLSFIFVVSILVALFILEGCATSQYYIGPDNALVINEIKARGAGQRLVISDLRPRKDGYTATYELFEAPAGAVMSAPYGGEVKMGSGSILSFEGTISLEGITFNTFKGDKIDPLIFTLLENLGLVYIRGKGSVILRDRREVFLP